MVVSYLFDSDVDDNDEHIGDSIYYHLNMKPASDSTPPASPLPGALVAEVSMSPPEFSPHPPSPLASLRLPWWNANYSSVFFQLSQDILCV